MKKIAKILAMLVILTISAKAQITAESTYSNVPGADFFGLVHLKNSGDKYVWVGSATPKEVILYNLDHSVWKTINLSSFPGSYVLTQYTSEEMFTTDGKVCLLLVAFNVIGASCATIIVNENSQVVFQELNFFPNEYSGSPAIFNTTDGVKMRLIRSDTAKQAKIYGLPGIITSTQETNDISNGSLSAFPNPTAGIVTIKYDLPEGNNSGEITLSNSSGQQINNFKVDKTFNDLRIYTSDMPAGIYFWQLKSGNYKTTQKMIVVK